MTASDLYRRVIDAPDLTAREKLCLCAFVSFADPDNLILEPPRRSALASAMSSTHPTLYKVIATLKGRGIIEVIARWREGEVLRLRPEAIPQGEPDDFGAAILRRATAFDRAAAEQRLAAETALVKAATAA